MEKKKVIVWFDDDAVTFRQLMQEVEKAGYEVKKVSQLRKSFAIAKNPNFFNDCVLIIMEPLHFLGMDDVPTPKSMIYYIRHYAKCNAPVIFFTVSSEDNKKMLEEYKEYGVVKILSKMNTFPSDIKPAIEEVLNKSK